jgi:hypothetical protein
MARTVDLFFLHVKTTFSWQLILAHVSQGASSSAACTPAE